MFPARKTTRYEPQKLRERHHGILRLAAQGLTDEEIAKVMGVTPVTVRYTRNSALGQAKLRAMRAALDESALDVAKQLQTLAPIGLHRITEVLVEDDPIDRKLQIQVAQDVLDRAGHTAVKRNLVGHVGLTKEDLAEIKQNASEFMELADDEDDVEDAQIIDEEDDD